MVRFNLINSVIQIISTDDLIIDFILLYLLYLVYFTLTNLFCCILFEITGVSDRLFNRIASNMFMLTILKSGSMVITL